ncbi:MAG TPA: hypothetical protein VM120_23150 [Bryobacteraceae bacterium]|nr:hypothetical protein [Bryobacteraceae bacterium]
MSLRAGPLSDLKVIHTLNSYFVPVYITTSDYGDQPKVDEGERAEWTRILREAQKANLSTGTVHAYALSPGGTCMDTRHVAAIASTKNFQDFLNSVVQKLHTTPGDPIVAPKRQSNAPSVPRGDLALHIVTRILDEHGESTGQGYTSHEYVVMPRQQGRHLGPKAMTIGTKWTLDPTAAALFLRKIYPVTEDDSDSGRDRGKILRCNLVATIVSVDGSAATASLTGKFEQKRTRYLERPDNARVSAKLQGYLQFDIKSGDLLDLALYSKEAVYGDEQQTRDFEAAVKAVD